MTSFRDIMKKNRNEMKMIWRVSPAHKKLQNRMEHIRKFRRQHEQLRSVIERVLRPDQQTMVDGNANEVRVSYGIQSYVTSSLGI